MCATGPGSIRPPRKASSLCRTWLNFSQAAIFEEDWMGTGFLIRKNMQEKCVKPSKISEKPVLSGWAGEIVITASNPAMREVQRKKLWIPAFAGMTTGSDSGRRLSRTRYGAGMTEPAEMYNIMLVAKLHLAAFLSRGAELPFVHAFPGATWERDENVHLSTLSSPGGFPLPAHLHNRGDASLWR